jgi:hypothetical protein
LDGEEIMKIYLVIELVDAEMGFSPNTIHGAFKSREKADDLKIKLLEENEWYCEEPFEIIFVQEMELQE